MIFYIMLAHPLKRQCQLLWKSFRTFLEDFDSLTMAEALYLEVFNLFSDKDKVSDTVASYESVLKESLSVGLYIDYLTLFETDRSDPSF